MPKKKRVSNHRDAYASLLRSRRQIEVADLYVAGKTQAQIAELLKISQPQVAKDLAERKAHWRSEANETLAAWREKEIAFTTAQRLEAEVQTKRTGNPKWAQVMGFWSQRLDRLMGLEAPRKIENTTTKSWLKGIEADKIEKSEVLAEANKIVLDEIAS